MKLFKKRQKIKDFQKTPKPHKPKKPKRKFVWSRAKKEKQLNPKFKDVDISAFTPEPQQKNKKAKWGKKEKITKVKKQGTGIKKKILLVSVILIFMLFTAYNISMYLVYHNYNKTSELTKDLDAMMKEVGETSPLYDRLENIRGEVGFMTAFCYDKEIEDKGDVLN